MGMALFTLWAEAEPSVVTTAIECSLSVFGYGNLKPYQAEALQVILRGKDVLLTVPTGYGKSLIYQMLPLCASVLLDMLGKSAPKTPLVLVVSPLVALMKDQASKLSRVAGTVPLLLTEQSGHIAVANPEALLATSRGRKMLLCSDLVRSVVAVAVDEAHCIVKW